MCVFVLDTSKRGGFPLIAKTNSKEGRKDTPDRQDLWNDFAVLYQNQTDLDNPGHRDYFGEKLGTQACSCLAFSWVCLDVGFLRSPSAKRRQGKLFDLVVLTLFCAHWLFFDQMSVSATRASCPCLSSRFRAEPGRSSAESVLQVLGGSLLRLPPPFAFCRLRRAATREAEGIGASDWVSGSSTTLPAQSSSCRGRTLPSS